jgi:hypothetical protein
VSHASKVKSEAGVMRAEHNLTILLRSVPIDVNTGKATIRVNTAGQLLELAETMKALGFSHDQVGSTMSNYDPLQGAWGISGNRADETPPERSAPHHFIESVLSEAKKSDRNATELLLSSKENQLKPVPISELEISLDAPITDRFLNLSRGQSSAIAKT